MGSAALYHTFSIINIEINNGNTGIPEVAIAYNYKEVGINNLAELRFVKVQLGQLTELRLYTQFFD